MNKRWTLVPRLALALGVAALLLAALALGLTGPRRVRAQGPQLFSEDFDSFAGTGFDSPPAVGQLDSNLWRIIGMSDGDTTFGGTYTTTGDFARGSSTGGVTSGGTYAFDVGGGNMILGAQPAGSDFTPGSFDLRLQNNTGSEINRLVVSYTIWTYNDADRANSLNFAYSLDDSTYTDVPTLDYVTPELADVSPTWNSVSRETILTDLALAPNDYLYLRWSSDDVSGGGSRDEIGIDNVVVAMYEELSVTKSVTPSTITASDTVTYTIVLANDTSSDEVGALFTDTLPSEVTFGTWIDQPSGATQSGNTITWSGNLSASTVLTFAFTANHVGSEGDVVVNTATYSGSQIISATATFMVAAPGDITFVYHDLEDVVKAGESVYLAGSFNGWDANALVMNADTAYETFSVTVLGLDEGPIDYKYIVDTDTKEWDWLNTTNRAYTVSGDATVDDYRDVDVGYALLEGPAAMEIPFGDATGPITGQVYIPNVTDPAGEGRGIQAQVGYGTSSDPATWDWSSMDFSGQAGNNDQFADVLTPTLAGVFSYTVRFDGNWGAGNPNAGWTYGDLVGVHPGNPFDVGSTGVLTVTVDCTTIYGIQYTPFAGGGTYPSPCLDERPTVEGVVYAIFSGRGFFMADAAGPWHGIYVYYPDVPLPEIGDHVAVTGTVNEYWGSTQLSDYATYDVLSSDNSLYGPSVVTAAEIPYGDAALSEPYEGVFVEVHDIIVTDPIDTHGIWTFTDASGGEAKADDWGYHAEPAVDDTFARLRGPLVYDFSQYKIMPRTANDLVESLALGLTKTAADNVEAGDLLTYTLTLANNTGIQITNVVLTDAVPTANATFAYALDGGVETNGVVSWTLPFLADGATFEPQFVVTATGTTGDLIVNDDYAAQAANWVTLTVGIPITTNIGGFVSIPTIQGSGFRSPYVNQTGIRTSGVVVGFFEGNASPNFDGFFIQDVAGDGDPDTSDAIYVKHATSVDPGVAIGDLVTVTGTVDEFSEYDGPDCPGDECQTQIYISNAGAVEVGPSTALPTSVELDPPGDPAAAEAYWESLEGMLVTHPNTVTVVGPTSYNTVDVVDGSLGLERVMRTGPHAGKPVGLRHYERYGDISGGNAPNLIVGSIAQEADGPLAFTYGRYAIITQQGDPWQVVDAAAPPATVPSWPAPMGNMFTAATYNTYNFTGGATKMTKVVSTVLEMGAPTFLALQEIEVTSVMTDLLNNLLAEGYAYDYAYSHPDVGGRGVALIWRTDQVENVTWSTEYQGCSAVGSSSSTYDPIWDECEALGEYPLFSRRPVVVTATVSAADLEVVVIANHFKSKSGGDPADDQRRLEQAQFVAGLVDGFVTEVPDIMVLGDLNDFEDSPPLEALYASETLTNTWYAYGGLQYSYIYQGVSQILDHILVSTSLWEYLDDISPMHYNADFPHRPYSTDPTVIWRSSDHDLVAAAFYVPTPDLVLTKNVSAVGTVALGEVLTYTLNLANDGDGPASGIYLTDTLPTEITFGGFAMGTNVTANYAAGVITWSGDLPAGVQPIAIVYTATVDMDYTLYGQTITNTASFTSDNAGTGQDQAAVTVTGAPNLDTSAKVSSSADTQVMPGDLVTYTITLSNTSSTDAHVTVTDTLGSYYVVHGAGDFTAAPTGTLTWTGTVMANSEVVLYFVAEVAGLQELSPGITFLENSILVDDGVSAPLPIADAHPPFVEVHAIYLPAVFRNYP